MKFCATYRVPHGHWRQVLQTFSSLTPEERADVGAGGLVDHGVSDAAAVGTAG
jgi:hypothetical protein